MKEGYGELLKKEIEKRKAWLDDHEGHTPETDAEMKNFKDFDEFKIKYDQNQVLFSKILNKYFRPRLHGARQNFVRINY